MYLHALFQLCWSYQIKDSCRTQYSSWFGFSLVLYLCAAKTQQKTRSNHILVTDAFIQSSAEPHRATGSSVSRLTSGGIQVEGRWTAGGAPTAPLLSACYVPVWVTVRPPSRLSVSSPVPPELSHTSMWIWASSQPLRPPTRIWRCRPRFHLTLSTTRLRLKMSPACRRPTTRHLAEVSLVRWGGRPAAAELLGPERPGPGTEFGLLDQNLHRITGSLLCASHQYL